MIPALHSKCDSSSDMGLYAHFIVYLCFLVQADCILVGFIQLIFQYPIMATELAQILIH